MERQLESLRVRSGSPRFRKVLQRLQPGELVLHEELVVHAAARLDERRSELSEWRIERGHCASNKDLGCPAKSDSFEQPICPARYRRNTLVRHRPLGRQTNFVDRVIEGAPSHWLTYHSLTETESRTIGMLGHRTQTCCRNIPVSSKS